LFVIQLGLSLCNREAATSPSSIQQPHEKYRYFDGESRCSGVPMFVPDLRNATDVLEISMRCGAKAGGADERSAASKQVRLETSID